MPFAKSAVSSIYWHAVTKFAVDNSLHLLFEIKQPDTEGPFGLIENGKLFDDYIVEFFSQKIHCNSPTFMYDFKHFSGIPALRRRRVGVILSKCKMLVVSVSARTNVQ